MAISGVRVKTAMTIGNMELLPVLQISYVFVLMLN